MAAPPRKWVSGGAPTLPCRHERAVARLLWRRLCERRGILRFGSHRQPLQTRAATRFVSLGRDAAPSASQVSAARRRFFWMQWRLQPLRFSSPAWQARPADGSAAARRPYPVGTSALSRGCCSGVSMSAVGGSDSAVIDSRCKPARWISSVNSFQPIGKVQ